MYSDATRTLKLGKGRLGESKTFEKMLGVRIVLLNWIHLYRNR